MSTRRIPGFARDMLVGAGLIVLITLVWVSLGRVSEWFDQAIQQAVREALREARETPRPSVESQGPQEVVDERIQEAVDAAVQDARQFFREVYGGQRGSNMSGAMSADVADRVIRFNISVMTRRYRMEMIEGRHRLREVDIGTQERLALLRARLGASVRATFGGSLDEQAFQDGLDLTTGTRVEVAAASVAQAFDKEWSVK